jgi:hypothetical protein
MTYWHMTPTWKTLVEQLWGEVVQVQVEVVLALTYMYVYMYVYVYVY